MKTVKTLIKSLLKPFDITITRYSSYQELSNSYQKLLRNTNKAADDIELLQTLLSEQAPKLLKYLNQSKSQLRQDLFVLSQLNFKRKGYLVEFGATNGVDLSNTYLMEKEFGWTGILAEPARCWHKRLIESRISDIEINCVWKDSHSNVTFNEVDVAELSTIQTYSDTDLHKERKSGKTYDVKTISLNDLLAKYNAPKQIDYLSIDTEGSEFEILRNFDFGKHSFQVITCEHNFTPMREEIYDLLSKNGYVRKYQKLSKFDDWYVKSKQLNCSRRVSRGKLGELIATLPPCLIVMEACDSAHYWAGRFLALGHTV